MNRIAILIDLALVLSVWMWISYKVATRFDRMMRDWWIWSVLTGSVIVHIYRIVVLNEPLTGYPGPFAAAELIGCLVFIISVGYDILTPRPY